jgi:hypothetical protein
VYNAFPYIALIVSLKPSTRNFKKLTMRKMVVFKTIMTLRVDGYEKLQKNSQ